jgi:hypothetical protein
MFSKVEVEETEEEEEEEEELPPRQPPRFDHDHLPDSSPVHYLTLFTTSFLRCPVSDENHDLI